jgi:hypothetical protein
MKKSLFEQMGGTYRKVGDYYIPDLIVSEEKQKPVGIWGQRHLRYIRQHKRVFYTSMLTSGKLNGYLADVSEQADDMFFRLVKEISIKEGITEQLKADSQMEWVGRMNNIRERVTEIINAEIIYSLVVSSILCKL